MSPDIIKNIQAFLERVQLQGSEVLAYIEVMQALEQALVEAQDGPDSPDA